LLFARRDRGRTTMRIYGVMAVLVVLLRLVFRVIFNSPSLSNIAIALPAVSIQIGQLHFSYLGPVSWDSLARAAIDGLHLAAIILAVAMANAVANPRKLLRSAPTALYEFATAAAVALNLAPQLITSLLRVRRAKALRGSATGLRNFGGLVVPVIEDAINKSLDLAASMDARGFGRTGRQKPGALAASRAAIGLALVLMAIATYLLLAGQTAVWIPVGLVVIALGSVSASMRLANLHQVRTRLELQKKSAADHLVRLLALAALVAVAAAQVPANAGFRWLA
ncbi:MAG: energy-coupling factor transporter transmembrane component T, partial [Micrococcales bacterium]